MTERRQLEFYLLRYVPDAVKEEFVNIGLVMVEPGASQGGFAGVRLTRDWRRVQCLDPQADIAMLEALGRDIRGQLGEPKDHAILLHWLEDVFSNVIQLSPAKRCLAEHPELEIETMASLYLEPARIEMAPDLQREAGPRQKIINAMTDAWKQAGVWKFLMHGIPGAPYTKAGDPIKFDFGYRVGNQIKLFHAVSLKKTVSLAVMLAYGYPQIANGMTQLIQARPALTAVIDDDLDRGRDEVQFALSAMEENYIQIAVAAEMPMIAEVAGRELKV